MRISDWSSDVCSSDLAPPPTPQSPENLSAMPAAAHKRRHIRSYAHRSAARQSRPDDPASTARAAHSGALHKWTWQLDRKRVVTGKRVSVRVDFGGLRILKKKNQQKTIQNTNYS